MLGHNHPPLPSTAFQRLIEQTIAASAVCSNEQVLDLADALHGLLRRRQGRSFAPVEDESRTLYL